MNSPFLQSLRERTADWHRRLEQNILSLKLLSDEVSLNDYRKYLCALYGFVEGFESHVYPSLAIFISDVEERRRANLLADDLTSLGQNPEETGLLPESYFHAMYNDPYAALGAMYVLEGSTLGGQLIQKHLRKALGPDTSVRTSYFIAHGNQTGPMWKQFLTQFITAAEQSDKQETIIDGALRTFRLLDQLMTDESAK